MPLSQRRTLTSYLIEERRKFPAASGELNALLLDIALGCKAISRMVSFGELEGGFDDEKNNVQSATIDGAHKPLDLISNDIIVDMTQWNGHLAGLASEELNGPQQIPQEQPRGKYLLMFDPLDGSGNLDVNVSVGSIFSILRAPQEVIDNGRELVAEDFLQAGTSQVAAGYALYGPTTTLLLSVGNGVAAFTLNPNLGEFQLTRDNIQIPADTTEFAINASNSRFWEGPVKRYVDECLAGADGKRNKDFNMRWIASTVAEAHRIFTRGGVFMYPKDTKYEPSAGRLRLLYKANPLGFLIEQAGGRASTGRDPVLSVVPGSLDQRIGFVFGSRNEVERIERYHREPLAQSDEIQLFANRSLFRD